MKNSGKLCKNCRYFRNGGAGYYFCMRPILAETEPILGRNGVKPKEVTCELERTDSTYVDRCGKEGKYWEKRKTFSEIFLNLFGVGK